MGSWSFQSSWGRREDTLVVHESVFVVLVLVLGVGVGWGFEMSVPSARDVISLEFDWIENIVWE